MRGNSGLKTFVFYAISTDPGSVSRENRPGMNNIVRIDLRMVLGNGRPNLDITIRVRDYGLQRFVKVSHAGFYNAGAVNDPDTDRDFSLVQSAFYRSHLFHGVRAAVTSTGVTH